MTHHTAFYLLHIMLSLSIFIVFYIKSRRYDRDIDKIKQTLKEICERKGLSINYLNDGKTSNRDVNEQFKYDQASCFDIESAEDIVIKSHTYATVDTGLTFDLPYTHELLIRPRSGLSSNGIQTQFGTVDSDYIGHVKVTIYNLSSEDYRIQVGDRIAQGFINKKDFHPALDRFKLVTSINDFSPEKRCKNTRGSKGFGSSGI